MSSVKYHVCRDESDSDEEVVLIGSAVNYSAATELLMNDDDESFCVQRRTPRTTQRLHAKMAQKAKDERKYKYSLVSILIIGICLIMMVNIGLGIRKCEQPKQNFEARQPSKAACYDKLNGHLFPWQKYRLPTSISPLKYHLYLHPNLTNQNYTGQVTIYFRVREDTHYVILHSRHHTINFVHLRKLPPSDTDALEPKEYLRCSSSDMLSMRFDSELRKDDEYQLTINYFGNLTFSLGGFYLSKYKKKDGSEKIIATTQFESTDARAAFPCFDEPLFKANFSLTMIREPGMSTLFNMPLQKTQDFDNGLKMDKFPYSLRMSTYLVAFIVSDFVKITNYTKNNLKVSIYAAADKVENTKLALQVAVDVMEYYEALFKIPFPLPKLDLVAIPDFAAGAMENWGLVTYRETSLLYNPATSSIHEQDYVALVIAHELSHQWFGDLVTMQWWNDLWLNEGFASFMEFDGVDKILPSFKIMSEIVTSEILPAMATDCSHYTHPITVPVTTNGQIQEIFDAISYSKGASLIYMLTDYLGDTFFKGVNTYLKKFQYKNAVNKDLLTAISEEDNNEHQDIFKLMHTWTVQPGFPVLKVSKQGNQIVVEQKRFLYPENASVVVTSPLGLWHIPLTYVFNQAPVFPERKLMTTRTLTLDVPQKFTDFKWVKFNHNMTGYYKVSYDNEMWDELISQMTDNHLQFTTNDRISIVADAFSMGRVGDLQYGKIFELVHYVKKEKSYTPFVTSIMELNYIGHILKFGLKADEYKLFQSYVVDLIVPSYIESAWKNTATLNRMQAKLQTLVVSTACSNNYQPCVDTALKMFSGWREGKTAIPADMMNTVFRTAVLHGQPSDWDYMWNHYRNSIDETLKRKILGALARSPKIERITFLQNELLKGDTIRSQSTMSLLYAMSSDVIGSLLTWKFVKDNWEKLTKIHPVAEFSMRRIIATCLSTLMSKEELSSAEAFFTSKGVISLKSIQRSLESTRINIYWAQSRLPEVSSWFNEHRSSWSNGRP